MSWLLLIAVLGGPILMLIFGWLATRNRFRDPSFLSFLKFHQANIANKCRKRPDIWSVLRYVLRFSGEFKRRVLIAAGSLCSKSVCFDAAVQLEDVLDHPLPAGLRKLFEEHRLVVRGVLILGKAEPPGTRRAPNGPILVNLDMETETGMSIEQRLARLGLSTVDFNFLWIKQSDALRLDTSGEALRDAECMIVEAPANVSGNIRTLAEQFGFQEELRCGGSSEEPVTFFKNNLITMTKLGAYGQFGNQVLQYAFLKSYTRQHGMRAQVPPWIGQFLFDYRDPPPEKLLPQIEETLEEPLLINPGKPPANVDVAGYFRHHTKHLRPQKDRLRRLFRLKPEIEQTLNPGVLRLRKLGKTIVGLHLRCSQWDCGHSIFFIAPPEWYLAWLRPLWPTLEKPILLIATDVPENVLGHFEDFDPWTCNRLGLHLPKVSFFPDYYMLSHADVMAISNSSFSFTASMLNTQCKIFMRPDNVMKKLVPYDPWDADPLLEQYVEGFEQF